MTLHGLIFHAVDAGCQRMAKRLMEGDAIPSIYVSAAFSQITSLLNLKKEDDAISSSPRMRLSFWRETKAQVINTYATA